MYQDIKKIVLTIVLMFTTIITVNAQDRIETTSLPKKGKRKTIKYTEYQYAAIGYVSNEQFVEGQEITFFETKKEETSLGYGIQVSKTKLSDTLVSGKYFIKDGVPYLDGFAYSDDRNSRVKGLFTVTNNRERNSLICIPNNANKLNIRIADIYYFEQMQMKKFESYSAEYSTLILRKLTDNTFSINIKYRNLTLETIIPFISFQEFDSNKLEYLKSEIIKSKKVKLSYNKGDVFTGSVIHKNNLPAYSQYEFADYVPNTGEYKYASGEVSTGVFNYNNYYQNFYLNKGTTMFVDGTTEKDDWLKNYDLDSNEKERVYKEGKSLTEMRNLAKSIKVAKDKKRQKSQVESNLASKEKLLKQQTRKKNLIAKYGDYYGNEISRRHLIIGMTKNMVNEVWKKEYFNISTVLRNNQMIEIWEFNKEKMQMDIINEGIKKKGKEGGEAAVNTVLMMNLYEEQFGEITFPKTLVFNNNKLTDIYN